MIDIQTIVYSRVKNKNYNELKVKFPQINFTTSNRELVEPKFPTVYIQLISSSETGEDLENVTLNAVNATIQIDVYDNSSMSNARYIMDAICDTMKTMHFSIKKYPMFDNSNEVYRQTARFSRLIGSGDTL